MDAIIAALALLSLSLVIFVVVGRRLGDEGA